MSKPKLLKIRQEMEEPIAADETGLEALKVEVEALVIDNAEQAADRVVTAIILELGPKDVEPDAEPGVSKKEKASEAEGTD